MKTVLLIRLSLFLLSMTTMLYAENATLRYSDIEAAGEFWDGIPSGRLLYRQFEGDSERGYFKYKSNDGKELIISGELGNLNVFLTEQVKAETPVNFVSLNMLKVVTFLAASDAVQSIELWHVKNYKAMGRDDVAERLATLYRAIEPPVSSEGRWRMMVYVLTPNWRIERWTVRGTSTPLSIIRFEREVLENSQVPPIPTTR